MKFAKWFKIPILNVVQRSRRHFYSRFFSSNTSGTSAHFGLASYSFQNLLPWPTEHISFFDGCQPVGKGRGEIITSSKTMALDERIGSKLFQTGSWTYQRLTTSFCSSIGMLKWKKNYKYFSKLIFYTAAVDQQANHESSFNIPSSFNFLGTSEWQEWVSRSTYIQYNINLLRLKPFYIPDFIIEKEIVWVVLFWKSTWHQRTEVVLPQLDSLYVLSWFYKLFWWIPFFIYIFNYFQFLYFFLFTIFYWYKNYFFTL